MKDSRTEYTKAKLLYAIEHIEIRQDAIDELVRGEYADIATDSIHLGEVLESLNESVDAL